jgi:hypothetical protein
VACPRRVISFIDFLFCNETNIVISVTDVIDINVENIFLPYCLATQRLRHRKLISLVPNDYVKGVTEYLLTYAPSVDQECNYLYVPFKLYSVGLPAFHGEGPQRLLWAGSLAMRGKITISGVPNRLNYCVLFLIRAGRSGNQIPVGGKFS